MSEQKINFTKENQDRLNQLAGDALFKGTIFKGGSVGNTETNIYDLVHNCQINTLSRYHSNLKKEIAAIDDLDEWSLTDHQKRKKANLEKQKELINLLIGYKRFREQEAATRKEYLEKRAKYNELKENTKTPEDRLKELEADLATYGNMDAEPVAE